MGALATVVESLFFGLALYYACRDEAAKRPAHEARVAAQQAASQPWRRHVR